MNYRELMQYGLTEPEAKVYLATLELGETTVDRIAKKTRQNRTSLYHTLGLLHKKGLVTKVRRGARTAYAAEDPTILREKIEQTLTRLTAALPALRSVANAIDKKPQIRYYEGVEEMREGIKDILRHSNGDFLFWFSDVSPSKEYMNFWINEFQPSRIAAHIHARAIGAYTSFGTWMRAKDKVALRRTRLDHRAGFALSAEVQLYGGNKVNIASHRDMLSLVIESKDIHDTLRNIFESHWNSLTDSDTA